MKANAKVEFTKNWWRSNRARACNGSGVGKALDNWVKHCKIAPKDFKKPEQFTNALDTCAELKKALKTAKGKCGKDQKETSQGIDSYEKQRGSYETAVRLEYAARIDQHGKDRKELLAFCKKAAEAMEDFKDEMADYEAYIDDLEEKVIDDVENGTGAKAKGILAKVKEPYQKASALIKAAETRFQKDGVFVKERRDMKYDAKSYGVKLSDTKSITPLFNKAVELSNTAGNHYNAVKASFKNIESDNKSITQLVKEGKKSADQMVAGLVAVAEAAEKMEKRVKLEVGGIENAVKMLATYAEKAKKSTLDTDKTGQLVKAYTMKLAASEKKAKQIHGELSTHVGKCLKRTPKRIKEDESLEPVFKRMDAALAGSAGELDKFNKDVAKAKANVKFVVGVLKQAA